MLYFGWSKDWQGEGYPEVSEIFIKSFVNKYFALPEDWDDDDVPLIMIFVKCRFCSSVQEHYVSENCANFIFNWSAIDFFYRSDAKNFVFNWDNTYTSFSTDVQCIKCGLVWSYKLEQFWSQQPHKVIQAYRLTTPQFDSPLENLFWDSWKRVCPIALTPQYPVGRYRIDFAHIPTKTAIELDGRRYHTTSYQVASDKRRQAEIEQQGWRFLRFKGEDICFNIDSCIIQILNFLSCTS